MSSTIHTPESAASFAARVERRSGLQVNRIPDAEAEVMLEGAIICSSPHGALVFLEKIGEDEDTGVDLYARAVLVNRGGELAPADPNADGVIPQE